jgi:Kef-type K+ transport system membrane component KefB
MAIETVLLTLGLLLIFAKLLGEITERIGITPVVGQVVAGIILGPVLGFVVLDSFMENFIELGIVFVLLMAGLLVHYEDIKEHVYAASTLAVLGGMMSFGLGFLVGYVFFGDILVSIAIGIIFIASSDDVFFVILRKTGEFKSRFGKLAIATTATDNIVGILALSFFTFFVIHGSIQLSELFKLFLIAIGFYLIVLTAGEKFINRALNHVGKLLDEQILLSIPLSIVFILAVISNQIGLGIATGAFLAGMTMAKNRFTETIILPKVRVVSDGFVTPLFYSAIGTLVAFSNLNFLFIIVLTIAIIIGKYVGCGLIGSLVGIKNPEERKFIGVMMIPRGDYNIAVAQIALTLGVFLAFPSIYTSVIFSIILTIILTPILLKFVYSKNKFRVS